MGRLDDTTAEPEAERAAARSDAGRRPLVEILFHCDLRRIGACTPAEAFEPDAPLVVGRDAPFFTDAETWSLRGPLGDPCISRGHLLARWIRDAGCFEIRLHESARLPVAIVRRPPEPAAEALFQGEPLPADRWVPVPTGTFVAVGNRLLLSLDERPHPSVPRSRMGMVGDSTAMWTLRDRVERVARFSEHVLLSGETGSGKERVAQSIHELSGREGSFVAVNMSQLDPELANTELFGHVRGAFTDARRDRAGAFERARGGTLFLDEIGDAAPAVQQRLLRVLEERRFTRLGDERVQAVESRIVAATHRDLRGEIQAGRFRLDLFERLNPLRIDVPPLRARLEDVPRLFRHFLDEQTRAHPELEWLWQRRLRASAPSVPIEFVLGLLRHSWPGNVRELRNLATATALLNLEAGMFAAPPLHLAHPAVAHADREASTGSAPPTPTPRRPRGAVARETVMAALEAAGYRQSEASRRLGVSRSTLVAWMKRYGIRRAKDLRAEEIEAVQAKHPGDPAAAAKALGVSLRAFRLLSSR
ncbi:MAG TPA: sigma-54 dependent transcriptional regulator [Myxococcota bacterium]|nr:sigma-54 dependent transcriptional regulator [Myxococcota bacterium]